ncbi:hypothetical protein L9F63_019425, partial [Diploptera punctata]
GSHNTRLEVYEQCSESAVRRRGRSVPVGTASIFHFDDPIHYLKVCGSFIYHNNYLRVEAWKNHLKRSSRRIHDQRESFDSQ